jgi:5-carboxymethyl-2-hydroxymuconate isomerase
VHVTIGLLAGRTDEAKARLTEAVLELLRQHVKPVEGLALHASAEVRDLDSSYRKFDA